MKRLLLLLLLTLAACTQAPPKQPPPPEQPEVITVGQVVTLFKTTLEKWNDYVTTHPACGDHVSRSCVSKGERAEVAAALKAYMATSTGPRSSTDEAPASRELMQAAVDYIQAVEKAVKP